MLHINPRSDRLNFTRTNEPSLSAAAFCSSLLCHVTRKLSRSQFPMLNMLLLLLPGARCKPGLGSVRCVFLCRNGVVARLVAQFCLPFQLPVKESFSSTLVPCTVTGIWSSPERTETPATRLLREQRNFSTLRNSGVCSVLFLFVCY